MSDLLVRVADAMRALEWYDSDDTSDWSYVRELFNEIGNLNS